MPADHFALIARFTPVNGAFTPNPPERANRWEDRAYLRVAAHTARQETKDEKEFYRDSYSNWNDDACYR